MAGSHSGVGKEGDQPQETGEGRRGGIGTGELLHLQAALRLPRTPASFSGLVPSSPTRAEPRDHGALASLLPLRGTPLPRGPFLCPRTWVPRPPCQRPLDAVSGSTWICSSPRHTRFAAAPSRKRPAARLSVGAGRRVRWSGAQAQRRARGLGAHSAPTREPGLGQRPGGGRPCVGRSERGAGWGRAGGRGRAAQAAEDRGLEEVPGQQRAWASEQGRCHRKEGGRVGVDAGSLRSVSRKAERAFHVQLQQLCYFLLPLGLCPVLDTSHQKPLASPSAPPTAPGWVHLPSRTHHHTQTDRLTHTDRQTHTRTH